MHWASIFDTLVMGIVVLVFLSIYRKRQSPCTWNWIAGWIAVTLHFLLLALAPARSGLAADLLGACADSALVVSGVLFFLATVELEGDVRLQRLLALCVTVPSLTYVAALVFFPRPWLLLLLMAVVNATLIAIWYRYVRAEPFSRALLLTGGFAFVTQVYCVLHGLPEYPVLVGLAALFSLTALSYWKRFHRPTLGVILAVVGFLAWGSVFMVADIVEFLHQGLIPPGAELWNLPKYFVAAAMILTLLEDEIASARMLMRRYRLQFDRSPCGVYRCTAAGEMLECNEAFAQIFQRNRNELLFCNVVELLGGASGTAQQFLKRLTDESPAVGIEFDIQNATGETRHLIGNASLVCDEPGKSGEIQGMLLDITDFKALQDQIRESQKLEALGLLAGGVAHDFNNLLMVISGHMELLEMLVGEDSHSRRTLEAVKSATQRGSSITGQLLAFSRKRPPETRLLDINALLQEVLNLLIPVVGEKVSLEVRALPNLKLEVMADENQLILVLLNMVINARDAMPSGGRIVIESSMVEFDEGLAKLHGLAKPGFYVCISVSDTGSGIPPEIQARVFEPFFSTKPRGKGTGLGLSICYGIVQEHHGTITIASTPGVGTTMRSYIPMVAGEAHQANGIYPPPRSNAGIRVLLVDDEELLREPACMYFHQAGFEAEEASSSEEALRRFRERPFDLVVTDMVMPGMNGKQLGEELKKLAPSVMIIYVSGYAQEILDSQGHLGANDIMLQKPYSLKRLVRLAEDELEKRGVRGPAASAN